MVGVLFLVISSYTVWLIPSLIWALRAGGGGYSEWMDGSSLYAKVSIFQVKILIRIRTPNRGIDPTVTHIHETITTQKNIEESFKED